MAKVEISGLSGAIQALERADLFTDQNASDILDAGTQTLLPAVHSAFVKTGYRRTGETAAHFRATKPLRKDKNGVPYKSVTVTGSDRRRQRYGTKAFVLNYGRRKGGKIPASYYWTQARTAAEPAVTTAMQRVADELLQKSGG